MERGMRKSLFGVVVSNKMDKTVVVSIESSTKHAVYNKIIKTTKKYKAHDEENTCQIGDKVEIVETRPLSREKRWRVAQIMEKAPTV